MPCLRKLKQYAIDLIAHVLGYLGYVLLYHVARYRRQVVADNLSHAMPDLSDGELRQLAKASHRHLARVGAEILLSPLLSREDFSRRVTFRNLDEVEKAVSASNQVIVLLIQQGNWEWILSSATANLSINVDPVYKTLHSPFWDRYMLRMRSRGISSPMQSAASGRSPRPISGPTADGSASHRHPDLPSAADRGLGSARDAHSEPPFRGVG